MTNITNAVNTERREFLIKHLTLHSKAPESLIRGEVTEASDEHMCRAYEALVYNRASFEKVFYLLGGNDPAKCPYGNVEPTPKEFLKGDMAQQFNESQEDEELYDGQDEHGL
jgi:hypothetical protein